jgi:arylsulfatase A-like enzyme
MIRTSGISGYARGTLSAPTRARKFDTLTASVYLSVPLRRSSLLVVAVALSALASRAAMAAGPSIVFVLLDTTRADRLSALGNPRGLTPALDALAARGVLFTQHFANSHATRPSLPQLMTGRYYHQNVLRAFTPDRHPREFPFAKDDPTAVLLPDLLRRSGYQTLGASAHWWVVPESALGAIFDRLEFVSAAPGRGHADAPAVIDRALTLWAGRDQGRATFLYVHLMDMHMPRFLPEGEPRFPVPGYDWRRRFRPNGEPLFDPERRRWSRADASDFTADDRAHFAAVYETHLAATDTQLGRLFARLEADDPDLRNTLVVVVADHGEELGENGRTDHSDSLVEGIQHIPWIVAGAGVHGGERVGRFTENIDVAPTVLALAHVDLPARIRMDGRPQLGAAEPRTKSAVYYAWETYRAIRTRHYLLRQERAGIPTARCSGEETLVRVQGGRDVPIADARWAARVSEALRRRLDHRLAGRERTFLAARYGVPRASFFMKAEFWRLGPTAVACVPVGVGTERSSLAPSGWMWAGRGVTVRDGRPDPLPITLLAPEGDYQVDAGIVPTPPMPWLFGFPRWLRKSFLVDLPDDYVSVGQFHASGGSLALALPADMARDRLVTDLRLTPAGAAPTGVAPMDEQQRTRLRALGYVE